MKPYISFSAILLISALNPANSGSRPVARRDSPAGFILHSETEPEFIWGLIPNPNYKPPSVRSGRFLDTSSPLGKQDLVKQNNNSDDDLGKEENDGKGSLHKATKYNARYPLTPPTLRFKFGVIADLDKKSLSGGGQEFKAYLKEGFIKVAQNLENPEESEIDVEWKPESEIHIIKTGFNYGGRGLELSTLNVFNGKIYSCGDKTGIVFELLVNDTSIDVTPVPWAILADGDSSSGKGFKCEWATVKDESLWIGGHGTSGSHKYLKIVSPSGQVEHVDWSQNYAKLAAAVKISSPGYLTNEAAAWSETLKKWVFAPRKISKEAFNEETDERSGSNTVLIADEDFNEIKMIKVGELIPTHGFSSIKFIPGTEDKIMVGIKSVEAENETESYIMAFDLKGNVLLNETLFASDKYEGVEFF